MTTPRKRVLLVSYHFPPSVGGGVPRLSSFARLLPELGWDVTVLTSPPAGRAALDAAPLDTLPKSVRVVRAYCPFAGLGMRGQSQATGDARGRVKKLARGVASALLFPDREVFWSAFAARAADTILREEPHHAVLSSYGPGSNVTTGMRIASKHRLPWVLDYRDLWSDIPHGKPASALHARALARIDLRAGARATKLTTVSPGMTEHMRARFGRREADVVTITNGFDDADIGRVHDARPPLPRPFELLYTGSVYGAYDFGAFFRALASLRDQKLVDPASLRVRFVGNMDASEFARHGVADLCVTEPFVPRTEVFAKMATADALVVIEGGDYWSRFGYPVKLFDYLLTGKPVLGLVEAGGNSARLLASLDQPHVAKPDDTAAIERAIRGILDQQGRPPRAVDTDAGPLAAFRRRNAIERLAAVLEAAVSESSFQGAAR